MQYTIRNVPPQVDRALRRRATKEGKSLNQVTVEALAASLGLGDDPIRYRDLSDLLGKGVVDPETEAALADQRRIDPDLWR
jgi:plasmid stability protein